MRVGSLFAGVGGFDLGFERAGMVPAWQVEIDPHAQCVSRYHWPEVERLADVRTAGAATLPAVDLICGGFPCTDLSVAGRRAGLAGEHSGLWWEFHRILGEMRPAWVVIENVGGLLSSNGGRDLGAILGALGELGYRWAFRCLDSRFFGLAQRRSLSAVLESEAPPRYYLSPKACRGILRRAEKRGKTLPPPLLTALKAVAEAGTQDGAAKTT